MSIAIAIAKRRLPTRMLSKINFDGPLMPGMGSRCWQWTAHCLRGYGQFRFAGKTCYAHRVTYELMIGAIQDEDPTRPGFLMQVDHRCKNHGCVNPYHMEVVTHAENVRRGGSGPHHNALKTHCPRGHRYTAQNTRRYSGKRFCLQCRKISYAARRRGERVGVAWQWSR